MSEPTRHIVGLGNYSMGDDGVGLRVIEWIEERGLARGFDALEAGNDGMRVLTLFREDVEKIVLVDCALMGRKPGEWAAFGPEDVETRKETGRISTHEGDMVRLIRWAVESGLHVPPVRFVAVEPETVSEGMSLSRTLSDRVPEYAAAAIREALS